MTSAPAVDGVIFDLDGTLVESLPTIALAMQEALAAYGIEKTIAEVYPIIGPPIETMAVQLGASPEDARLIGVEYRRRYDEQYIQRTEPCAGARELLDDLDAAGIPYAIVTNKREYSGLQMLDVMGWRTRVRALAGRDTEGAGEKPDPAAARFGLRALGIEASRAAFVGDTEFDMRCGRDAGIAFVIGVLGARSAEQLRAEGATHVATSLDAVGEILLGAAVSR